MVFAGKISIERKGKFIEEFNFYKCHDYQGVAPELLLK